MSAPADWYPNPDGTGGYRWWTGAEWGRVAPVGWAPTVAPPAPRTDGIRPSVGLGIASSVLVVAATVNQVLLAVTAFPAVDRMRESVALTGTTEEIFTAYHAVSVLNLPLLLATYVVTCLWLWRMRKNADALSPDYDHARGRGWIWGGWICPIVGLWFPFQVVRDIVAATAQYSRAGRLLGWWWASMLAFEVGSYVAGRTAVNPDTFEALGMFETTSAIGAVLAAPMWIMIVRRVRRTQDESAAALLRRSSALTAPVPG